jgi:hypothetical protein
MRGCGIGRFTDLEEGSRAAWSRWSAYLAHPGRLEPFAFSWAVVLFRMYILRAVDVIYHSSEYCTAPMHYN